MNFSKIEDVELRSGATASDISNAEILLGKKIPNCYKNLLKLTNGFYSDEVHLYSTSDIVERNQTYEIDKYCPQFISIGDDGGGSAVLLEVKTSNSEKVFLLGHGALSSPEFKELIGNVFSDWIDYGCPLEEI